jgi:uncharacterized repeat protein (TIGR03803 family)
MKVSISSKKRSLFMTVTLVICSFTGINGQHAEFYGMTSEGGKWNGGIVFKFDRNNNSLEVIKDFEIKYEGKNPYSDLCLANNGKFYGMTYAGGEHDLGVLFEWDPVTNIYVKKLDFNGAEKGARPMGSLIKAKNGKLYGMTSEGGTLDYGVLFEWNTDDNLYVKKLDFPDEAYERGIGDLMQADDGKFYGLNYGFGSIFEWDPTTNIYKLRFHFDEYITGYFPFGRLTQAGNGKLYGVAQYGGKNHCGTIFEWDPVSGVFTVVSDFDPATTLEYPVGALVLANNGKLYGMCEGRFPNYDAIYEIDPNTNTLSKKLEFNTSVSGYIPQGSFIKGNNGKLFGMTAYGGSFENGLIFEWDPVSNRIVKKADLKGVHGYIITPNSISQTADGRFYGMYNIGGYDNSGSLFECDTTSAAYTEKFSFNSDTEGRSPKGDLVLAGNGKLYGMTSYGGVYDDGVIFEIDTATNKYIKKFDFKQDTTGGNPSGSLMVAKNGKLYGMTDNGGKNDDGVLFEWDPATNKYSIKSEFEDRSRGMGPKSRLIEGSNHVLYGVSQNGGIHYSDGRRYYSFGVLFEYDPVSNSFSKKHDFDYERGYFPSGAPLIATDGKLYGQTITGGSHEGGVIYSWDPLTSIYTVKYDFFYYNYPQGSLVQAGNGKLYGLTSGDGVNSKGVLYEFDPVNSKYTVKVNFDGSNKGSKPFGSLVQGSNGKLYGLTQKGGILDKGVLFEWDPSTGNFLKLADFKGSENGALPYGSLLEISHEVTDTIYVEACNNYLSPSGKYTFSTTGVYKDFLTSSTGVDSVITIFLKIKSTAITIIASACESYTSPSGRYTWTNSGIYTDTIPNKAGCDSIITLNLTIRSSKIIVRPVACEKYTSPSGRYTWTRSGEYKDTIPNAAGCDSVITVNLTVINPSFSENYISACSGYTSPSGKYSWSESGVYRDTISNSSGCDSIMVIRLTINHSAFSAISVSACYSYNSPSGKHSWTTDGIYTDTIPSSSGCDSIISIHLVINHSTASTIDVSACDSYDSPSGMYTWISGGTYRDTIPSAAGCDSMITINLQIDHVDTSVIQDRNVLISNDENAIHQWIDCDKGYVPIVGGTFLSYSAPNNGHYAVIVSNGVCVDTSAVYEVLGTGITDPAANGITIYPNPTAGKITIDLGMVYPEAIVTITRYDGQVIRKEIIRNTRVTVMDLNEPPGIYMVTVTIENREINFRVIKN